MQLVEQCSGSDAVGDDAHTEDRAIVEANRKGCPIKLARFITLSFVKLVFLLIPLISVEAQNRIDTWTTDNGLPQNSVTGLTQTPDGYIWFSTNDGLVRFDGVR